MFETCMVESAGQYRSTNRRWTTAAAFLVEGALLAIGVVAALVHTDAIANTVRLVSIEVPFVPAPVRTDIVPGGGGGGASALRPPTEIPTTIATGGSASHVIGRDDAAGNPDLPTGLPVGTPTANTGIFTSAPTAHVKHQRIVVSSMDPAKLVQQVTPVYPPIARAAGISGAVQLHAIIAKDGTVQNLQVISGHPLLTRAALDAVQRWRYKPTILGGEAV